MQLHYSLVGRNGDGYCYTHADKEGRKTVSHFTTNRLHRLCALLLVLACMCALATCAPTQPSHSVFDKLVHMLEDARVRYPTAAPNNSVAFFKTHKTGSSTMASVLYRRASHQHLRVYESGTQSTIGLNDFRGIITHNSSQAQFDMAFQHLPGKKFLLNITMSDVFVFFRTVVHRPYVFSIIREPYTHALSYSMYFYVPRNMSELNNVILTKLPSNPMAVEFGIHSDADLDRFLAESAPQFELLCVTEMFDECLVLLRRALQWPMRAITYQHILDSHMNLYECCRSLSTSHSHISLCFAEVGGTASMSCQLQARMI